MALLDVFNQDPFTTIQLTLAVERVPYLPQGLDAMNIFEPKPIRTKVAMVEQRQGVLTVLPFSDRGSPGVQRTTELRSARHFLVPRIRMEDTIYAEEIQAIRAFGQETELMQVQQELGRRMVGPTGLRANIDYTREYHRLAAIQGLLLNSNGSVRFNWFNEFEIAQDPEIVFNFAAINANYPVTAPADMVLGPLLDGLIRTMQRRAQGAWTNGTTVVGLSGDAFYDALRYSAPVRSTFVNWPDARQMRENLAFQSFYYGGVEWVNYRGSADVNGITGAATSGSGTIDAPVQATMEILGQAVNTVGLAVTGPGIPSGGTVGSVVAGTSFTLAGGVLANETESGVYNFGPAAISVPSNKVKFFPRNAPGVFQQVWAPGESFEWINTLGKPEYVRVIPDRDRNEWVKAEMTSYPLHICTRPEILQSGTMDATAD